MLGPTGRLIAVLSRDWQLKAETVHRFVMRRETRIQPFSLKHVIHSTGIDFKQERYLQPHEGSSQLEIIVKRIPLCCLTRFGLLAVICQPAIHPERRTHSDANHQSNN